MPGPYGVIFKAVEPIKEDTQAILSRLDEIVTRLNDLTSRIESLEKTLTVRK